MGTLVFQANLGGAVNLIGPNTASTVNFTLPSADGTSGQALVTNGSGTLSFSTFTSGAAGSNTQVQFNSSGAFAGSSNLTFNGTTLTAANTSVTTSETLSYGTANGVAYLNGSKVVTTGSALTFDGTNLGLGTNAPGSYSGYSVLTINGTNGGILQLKNTANTNSFEMATAGGATYIKTVTASDMWFGISNSEAMRLTSTGLGIGTSSPLAKLQVKTQTNANAAFQNSTSVTGGVKINCFNDAGSASSPFEIDGSTLQFNIASVEKMRLDSSGNLGLGVTPSAWSSGGQIAMGSNKAIVASGEYNNFGANWYYSGGYNKIVSGYASNYYQNLGAHTWQTAGTGSGTFSFTSAMTLTAAGRLGLGLTSPSTLFEAYGGAAGTSSELTVGNASTAARFGVDTSNEVTVATGQAVPIKFLTSNTERARIDSSGNLLVGDITGSSRFLVKGRNSSDYLIQAITNGGTTAVYTCASNASLSTGESASASVWLIRKDGSTSRSINAAGTVNASGADYAEYMTKCGDFTVAKGDVVGIDAQGKLTNVFVNAVSFVVKSTDPSYVGGDTWGNEQALGLKIPSEESTQKEKDAFNEAMENARKQVDRVAFAGQVPVNVMDATPGQYIVPENDNGAIKGVAVSNPTFEQYQIAVGKVIAVEPDGRAKIIVKVA